MAVGGEGREGGVGRKLTKLQEKEKIMTEPGSERSSPRIHMCPKKTLF